VDVNGWTTGNRAGVLAARPGGLQMQWLGYPGTLGAPWIDYVVADSVLIPPAEEKYYSEKIIRLPGSYQPSDDKRPVASVTGRHDNNLPADALVFCSFNQSYKITREIFDVWIELLQAVSNSVLWLLQPNPTAADALRVYAEKNAISADRLIFAPMISNAEHRGRIHLADLALDCFPYGSHTTGSDMLYAGVPFVAIKGDTFASRVSASLLRAANLPELVAGSLSDYRALAMRLATDRDRLAELRRRMETGIRRSALFDTAGFTRYLEKGIALAWERDVAKLPPASIDVAA
jgi:predicted O-linked N-acetylglucosamine transferase (SPINDLY family)